MLQQRELVFGNNIKETLESNHTLLNNTPLWIISQGTSLRLNDLNHQPNYHHKKSVVPSP